MFCKRRVADFHSRVHYPGRVEASFDLHKEVVQLLAEHASNEFRAHPSVPMLSTDRSAEPSEDRLVNGSIAIDHSGKVVPVIHVQQGHDMRVAVPDVAEDGDRDVLCSEKFFQVPDELANPISSHDHIIHVIDGLLALVVPVEGGIQGLACVPELVALSLVEGHHGI